MEGHGFAVTVLPVDTEGRVSLSDVVAAIRSETVMISIMHANNEVGTIQPITEIASVARRHGILMHMDNAQSVGKIPTRVDDLGVDLLSFVGHKIYAPRGLARCTFGMGSKAGSLAMEPARRTVVGQGRKMFLKSLTWIKPVR